MSEIKTLEITTNVGCPVRCSFCPQSTLVKKYKNNLAESYKSKRVMTHEDFVMFLSSVPKDVRIDFSGMSEPFAAPDCIKMIEHAVAEGYSVVLYTTLYGATVNDVERIYSMNLPHVEIHLPDDEGNFKAPINEAYIRTLRSFYGHASYDPRRIASMSMSRTGRISPQISAAVTGGTYSWNPITRAGNLFNDNEVFNSSQESKKRLSGSIYCHATPSLVHNVLLPNGDVCLCCMDYGLEAILGNLSNSAYSEIMKSETQKEILRKQEIDDGNDILCRYCDCARQKTS